MDLLDLFKNYLFSQEDKPSRVTVKNYLSDVNHFVRWYESFFAKKFSPRDITNQTLGNYRSACGDIFSASSLDRHFSSLRKFFNFLLIDGQISLNPFLVKKLDLEAEKDPWHIKDFKNYLYVYNASHLTIKNYLIDIKQFLSWASQVTANENVLATDNLLARVDSKLVEEYKQRLLSQGNFSPATINRKLSSLRRYLGWAVEENLLGAENLQLRNVEMEKPTPSTIEIVGLPAGQPSTTQAEEKNSKIYSGFPPLRLGQKISQAFVMALDSSLIIPLAKTANHFEYLLWKTTGQPIFRKISNVRAKQTVKSLASGFQLLSTTVNPQSRFATVKNLPKEFYAPLEISTKNFPWYKKAYFTARYNRPKWYKTYHSYPIVHYLHFAVLVIFLTAISFGFYNAFFQKGNESPTFAQGTGPIAPPRILSFQGRLTDNFDTPISTPSALRFAIYGDPTASQSAGQRLWEEVDYVTPDQNGIFNVILGNGSACGAGIPTPQLATGSCQIPRDLFTQYNALWLGVTVGNTPELTPRQQLATVAYATNAETLQGLQPITSTTSATNVVLALDSSGNLTIGGTAAPTFQASGGQFKILGQPLFLGTNVGSNSNVTIVPDGLGNIDLQKPLVNTSNNSNIAGFQGGVEIDDMLGVLATSSVQAALTLNQTGGGLLINASASGITKFMVDSGGDATIAGHLVLSNPAAKTTFGGIAYAWPGSIPSNGYVLSAQTNGQLNWTLPASGGVNWWNELAGALSPLHIGDDLLLGNTTTTSATFAFTGLMGNQTQASFSGQFVVAPNNGYGGNASVAGTLTLGSYGLTGTIQTTSNQALTIGGNTTGNIGLMPLNGSGITGIGGVIPDDGNGAGGSANGAPHLSISDTTSGHIAKIIINGPSSNGGGAVEFMSGGATQADIGWTKNSNELQIINRTKNNTTFYQGGSGTGNLRLTLGSAGTIAAASVSGNTSFASLVANNDSSVGDLFTASASGWTRFRIDNNGNVSQTGNLTLSNPAATTTFGGTTYTWPTGAIGGNGYILSTQTNGALNWVAQSTNGVNWWNELAGALSPVNVTDDLLLGNTTTTSAVFAFTGLQLPTHQTQASFSGQFVVAPNNGYGGNASIAGNLTFGAFTAGNILTTNNRPLNIGGNTTGNLVLAPLNGVAGSNVIPSTNQQVDLGTSTNQWRNLYAQNIMANGVPLLQFWQEQAGALSPLHIGDDLLLGNTTTTSATFAFTGLMGNQTQASFSGQFVVAPNNGYGGNASVAGTLTLGSYGLTGTIQTTSNQALTIGGNTTGNIQFKPGNSSSSLYLVSNGNVGIGTNNPLAPLQINGGYGANSALIVNQLNGGDLITASASGITKFRVDNNGDLILSNTAATTTFGGTTYTWPTGAIGGNGYILSTQTNGALNWISASSISAAQFWQELHGALSPTNIGDDLLLGNNTTTSATFAFTGLMGNQTQASFSGQFVVAPNNGYGGNASVSGTLTLGSYAQNGTIQTTRNQLLTLGGNTTGDIQFKPGNSSTSLYLASSGNVGIGTTVPGSAFTIGNPVAFQVTNSVGSGGYVTFSTPNGDSGMSITGAGSRADIRYDGTTLKLLNNGSSNTTPGSTAGINIDGTGQVGIGTTTPGYLLHVYSAASNSYIMSQTAAGNGTSTEFKLAGGATNAQWSIGTNNSTYGGLADSLYFYKNAGTGGTKMVIQDNGFVGIGNTAPRAALDIGSSGNASISGNLSFLGASTINTLNGGSFTFEMSPGGDTGLVSQALITAAGQVQANSFADIANTTYFLDLNSTTTSMQTKGEIIVGDSGGGKIAVTTIDPMYTIDGTRYSTYVPSMTGVNEEVSGRANLTYDPNSQAYTYVLDLNNQPVASNVWLFSRVVDPDISLTDVLLSPDSSAKTWYEKDTAHRTITFYSDRPTEISYRLTAPRFDYQNWNNLTDKSQTTSQALVAPTAQADTWPGISTSSGLPQFVITGPTIDVNGNPSYALTDSFGNVIKIAQEFSDLIAANVQAGLVNADTVTANALSVATDNITINGQNIKDYITTIVKNVLNGSNDGIISPIASIDQLHTNFVSPVDNTSNIALDLGDSKLTVRNGPTASSAAVAVIDNQGNASFAGQLNSSSLTTGDATISGTLYAGKILASDIEGLNLTTSTLSAQYITNVTNIYNGTSSAGSDFGLIANAATPGTSSAQGAPGPSGNYIDISSLSGQLGYVPNLISGNAIFGQNLIVYGSTSLADTSVVGQLAVNGSLILSTNSINTLGNDLQLQPLRQGGLSVMAGLFYIDTNGNVTVGGNADFAKNVTVHGNLATNVISPLAGNNLNVNLGETSSLIAHGASNSSVLSVDSLGNLIASGEGSFAKLNLNPVQPAFAISPDEVVATGSAGTANISAYQTQVTIDNPLVTGQSLIYITPTSNTNNQVLYLLKQLPGESFTVGIQSPSGYQIPFNWIIVN